MSSHRFVRSFRLLKTDDFSSVFRFKKIQRMGPVLCYSKPNDLGHARLGLAVSKRVHKHAVARNYMKRRLREWFRQEHTRLPSYDYVWVVKTAFSASSAAPLLLTLEHGLCTRQSC